MELDKYSNQCVHYYGQELPRMVSGVFKAMPVGNFADLGCGDGSLLYSLFALGYIRPGSSVIAVDISRQRLDNVGKIDPAIKVFLGDVSNLSMIEDGTLDFAVSSQVIEHVPEQAKAVSEAYRILRPGGSLYLSTVFKKRYAWYFYRCQGKWVLDPTHLREYEDPKELLDIVRGQGFKVLEDKKSLQWFALTDFILKRLYPKQGARYAYRNKFLKLARNLKIPILGYYNWELLLKKT